MINAYTCKRLSNAFYFKNIYIGRLLGYWMNICKYCPEYKCRYLYCTTLRVVIMISMFIHFLKIDINQIFMIKPFNCIAKLEESCLKPIFITDNVHDLKFYFGNLSNLTSM